MTNVTKWLVAIPFTALFTVILPALIAGDPWWFVRHWTDTLYAALSAGMWLGATAFVDVDRPRGRPDLANRLIPLGLVLAVPVAVWDRTYWMAAQLPLALSWLGIAINAAAILLGVTARHALGRSYSPRATRAADAVLVEEGPYRWIRHPLYLAAVLWAVGWPLTIRSLVGMGVAVLMFVSIIPDRIEKEEAQLRQAYGEAFADYQKRTWRLIPFIY